MYSGKFRKFGTLPHLDEAILAEISGFARAGLTKEEILDGYSLAWEDMTPEEQQYFDETYRYGRVQGIKAMSDALFLQARGKQGTPAALAFLARFSIPWQKELQDAGALGKEFTFKMIV